MLFIKAFTSYFHIYRPPTPPTVPSPIVRHHPSDCPIGAMHRHRRKNRRRAVSYVSTGLARLPRDAGMHAHLPPKSSCRKRDRWLGFQPSVSVSLRSAVRLLVDNTTLFDTSLLACKVAQIVQFCTTHFTKLVDCDAVDKR